MIKEDNKKNYASSKIISLEEAARKISELKKQEKTSGLCSGGFDLLHPGHIRHFESAKKICDTLFVAVAADKNVSKRKGNNRPIFSEILRAYSIAGLQSVDYVMINRLEQSVDIIKKLKPTFYIKGPDFIGKTTPGITAEREAIESAGGQINYTKDQKLSTTDIIRQIQSERRKRILLGIDRDGTLIEHVEYLGRDRNWKDQTKIKKPVADILIYAQTRYDTTKVVVSNQQGAARGYFKTSVIEDVNKHISSLLKGVTIDDWQYCPDVDKNYAEACGETFNPAFVKGKTARKPSPKMLLDALKKLGKKLEDFDSVIILGNSQDDAGMAKSLHAKFIDVTGKSYEQLKEEFEKITS